MIKKFVKNMSIKGMCAVAPATVHTTLKVQIE
jgi:hypothetical protein